LTLAAQALECARGGRTLFTGLSFTLEPGEALRIAGANGSGKTSLLRILCGLLAPTQGEVRWDAMPIGQLQEEYSRRLVYLGHSAALKDELSAAENLAITCRLAGQAVPPASLDEALARFGLRGSRAPVKRLSQGQRRRAALARLALSEERPLWLLDEPFAALDGEGVKLLEGLVARHLSRGGAVAFTTHQDAGIAAAKRVDLD
jgi:heme exporter protein A